MTSANESMRRLLSDLNERQIELGKEQSNTNQLIARRNQLSIADSILSRRLTNEIAQHRLRQRTLNLEISRINGELGSYDNEFKALLKKATANKEMEITRINEEIDNLKNRMRESGYEELIKREFGGFQAHMLAFSKMKEENPSTATSSLFIMLLFIIIETAPTFFKMMIASGPYDDLLRSEMHKARVMSDKRISDLNDEINTEIMISTEKNKNRLEAEVVANKQVLSRIAEVQSELLNVAIEKWRVEELEKIAKNPSAYIKSSSTSNETEH